MLKAHGKKGLPPPPLGKNTCQARTHSCSTLTRVFAGLCNFSLHCGASVLAPLLNCTNPVRFTGTVLSLRGAPVGRLPCPATPRVLIPTCCYISFRSLLPHSLRSLRSAWSLHFIQQLRSIAARSVAVHPPPHNVRHPAGGAHLSYVIWRPLRSRPTTKVEPRLVGRRPPAGVIYTPALRWQGTPAVRPTPVQQWAPRGGGGGTLQPVRSVVPPALPAWRAANSLRLPRRKPLTAHEPASFC